MALWDYREDVTVGCPFNRAHKMARRKYQIHLTRCPDRFDYAVCPFNAEHRPRHEDLEIHKVFCPDAKRHLRDMIHTQTAIENGTMKQPLSKTPPVRRSWSEASSGWGDDAEEKKSMIIPGLQKWTLQELLNDDEKMTGHINPMILSSLTKSERKIFTNKRMELMKKRMDARKAEQTKIESTEVISPFGMNTLRESSHQVEPRDLNWRGSLEKAENNLLQTISDADPNNSSGEASGDDSFYSCRTSSSFGCMKSLPFRKESVHFAAPLSHAIKKIAIQARGGDSDPSMSDKELYKNESGHASDPNGDQSFLDYLEKEAADFGNGEKFEVQKDSDVTTTITARDADDEEEDFAPSVASYCIKTSRIPFLDY